MEIQVNKPIRQYSHFTKKYNIMIKRTPNGLGIHFGQTKPSSHPLGYIGLPNRIAQSLASKIIEALASKEEVYLDGFSVNESKDIT